MLNYETKAGPTTIGRYCALEHVPEVTRLEAGMDFRHPRYRREVFLRFYEFHLKYRAHPGAVYYVFPYLFEKFNMNMEQRLWFAFINGNTQHPVTSLAIWKAFPDFKKVNPARLEKWFNARYEKLAFDTDRRYHRKEFLAAVSCYQALVGRSTQEDYFLGLGGHTEEERFRAAWPVVSKQFWSFGRLSSFSYLEYLRIAGIPLDCDQLFLEDMSGSKSHRNGLAKVLGRDDLDWHKSTDFDGKYAMGQLDWMKEEAAALRTEARKRLARKPYDKDVGYFTLESALCTYKSWHRPNRRYPNCYNDMFFNRISQAPESEQQVFWDARQAALPAYLRLEDTPGDPGLSPRKQNWYRETGQVIMMDRDWACFKNDFNGGVKK